MDQSEAIRLFAAAFGLLLGIGAAILEIAELNTFLRKKPGFNPSWAAIWFANIALACVFLATYQTFSPTTIFAVCVFGWSATCIFSYFGIQQNLHRPPHTEPQQASSPSEDIHHSIS